MASLERLQNEILLKEEAFLKEERAKLTEQLNKLKVEEMALMKLLKSDNTNSQQTTMELFTKNSQLPSTSSQRIDSFETETEVNHIPLQGLNTIEINKEDYQGEEEEEDDDDYDDDDDMDDDDTEYSQQLMNAMSSLHYQNNNAGQDISRSVLHSVLQQEIEGLDDDDDYYHE
ncbi:hypothetical protein ACROYT_G008046 [Oculina patagonica]